MATISAITWIPRGAARANPTRFDLSEEDVDRLKNLALDEVQVKKSTKKSKKNNVEIEEENDEEAVDEESSPKIEDEMEMDEDGLPKSLQMDKYDEEEAEDLLDALDNDDEEEDDDDNDDLEHAELELLNGNNNDMAGASTLHEEGNEDAEDDALQPQDTLLCVAVTEDDYSHLEVQVLTGDGGLYVHHDILLPEIPLAIAWMNYPPDSGLDSGKEGGNYMALGYFSSTIEVWDLDILDVLEPCAYLGDNNHQQGQSSKAKRSSNDDNGHSDSVTALAWNTSYRHILGSGSNDTTVRLWDLTTCRASYTYRHHSARISTLLWSPSNGLSPHVLVGSAVDGTVSLMDCRSAAVSRLTVLDQLSSSSSSSMGDIESLAFDPSMPFHLYGGMESGYVWMTDLRYAVSSSSNSSSNSSSSPLQGWQAHGTGKSITSLSFSSRHPGLLITASLDKTVKVWDTLGCYGYGGTGEAAIAGTGAAIAAGTMPRLVSSKSMNVGRLYAMSCYPYCSKEGQGVEEQGEEEGDMVEAEQQGLGYLCAAGGEKGVVAVWEMDEQQTIVQHFTQPTRTATTAQGMNNNNNQSIGDYTLKNDYAESLAAAGKVLSKKAKKNQQKLKKAQQAAMDDDSSDDDEEDEGRGSSKKKGKKGSKKSKGGGSGIQFSAYGEVLSDEEEEDDEEGDYEDIAMDEEEEEAGGEREGEQDLSWMEDNSGIATNNQSNNNNSKKKDKKKNNKSKGKKDKKK